jgi:hypothetical protein
MNASLPTGTSSNFPKKQKISLNFSERDVERAKRLARRHGLTMTEVIKRALSDAEALDQLGRDQATFIVLRPGSETTERVFFTPW